MRRWCSSRRNSPRKIVAEDEQISAELPAVEAESRGTIPPQPASDILDLIDVTAEVARLERLEAELADERARVDRVTAELAALRRVVVEQRQKSSH